MVYAVNALIAFSTTARRDAVLADMQSRIAGKPRWGVEIIEAAASHYGADGIRLELRFTSQADADDLKARIEAFATGARLPQPGSWLRVHSCTHDEATNNCALIAERVWT